MLLRVMRRADFSDSSDQEIEPNGNKKDQPKVGLKEWLHSISHGQPQNNHSTKRLVLNYLISEGYYDIAKTFSEQANIPMNEWTNQQQTRNRYQIKNLIRKGQINEAINKIGAIDSQFCSRQENQWAIFLLKCLKVIHLIKKNQFEEAIRIGKEELLPYTAKEDKYLVEVQRVMSLIAFVNVKDCPHSQLASQEHSNNVANMINKQLVHTKTDQSQCQSLEMVLKMGKWCERQLSQYLNFPKFNLQGNQQLFIEQK